MYSPEPHASSVMGTGSLTLQQSVPWSLWLSKTAGKLNVPDASVFLLSPTLANPLVTSVDINAAQFDQWTDLTTDQNLNTL